MCCQNWCLHLSIFHSCSIQSGNYFSPLLCGYFLGLLSSSLLISGREYILSWWWVEGNWSSCSGLDLFCTGERVALVPFFGIAVVLIVALVLMVLHTTMTMGCYMQCQAGIARSLDHTIFGRETGGCTLSSSNNILWSWIGCSWCGLDSNGHSSDTPTRVMLGECKGYCWCGLDSNWSPLLNYCFGCILTRSIWYAFVTWWGGLLAALYIFCKIKWPFGSSMKRSVWSRRLSRDWGFLHSFPWEWRKL